MNKFTLRNSNLAFSLVELLVVIGLLAIATAIIFPFVKSTKTHNKGMGCQMNMKLIHQALKLYWLDWNGYPPFDLPNPCTGTPSGEGLFTLHAVRIGGSVTQPQGEPLQRTGGTLHRTGYLRSYRTLHCPADQNTAKLDSWGIKPVDYSSYMADDNASQDPSCGDRFTYFRTRTTDASNRRQLRWRFADDSTVLVWCLHHRRKQPDGTYSPSLTRGEVPADIVLYLDGSVRIQQSPVYKDGTKTGVVRWQSSQNDQ